MADRVETALDWVDQLPEGKRIPLGEVEIRVRIDAGDERPDSCVQTLLEAIAWLAPLVALALFATPGTRVLEMEPVPGDVAVPAAGVLSAIALLGPPLTLVRWLRRGRRRSGLTVGTNIWTLVLACAGGMALTLAAGRSGSDPAWWGVLPWAVAAFAIIALAVQLIWSAPPPDPTRQRLHDAELLRARSEVLTRLRDRGLIDEPTRTRAEQTPFGDLAQLDRERRSAEQTSRRR